MRKGTVTFVRKQFSNRKNLFLKDPNSDFFVILNQKIYPLHKAFINGIGYFEKIDFGSEKVHMIDSNLDQTWFESVIAYYYGKQLQFQRSWGIIKLLQVLDFLQISETMKKIINDIKANFDDYGFFLLVTIAQKYSIKWLKEQCQQQLILMGFEQLNYNRYDLFQVDRNTFQYIIKLHQLLKINKNIVGLRTNDLKRIISQYCKHNNFSYNEIDKLLSSCQNITIQKQNIQKQSMNIMKRSNKLKDTSSVAKQSQIKQKLVQKQSPRKSQQTTINLRKQTSLRSQQNSQSKQLDKLKLINSQIQHKNLQFMKEIQNFKGDIQKSSRQQQNQIDIKGIQQKFKKFQKLCEQQNAKYEILKAQMQKLNSSQKKNQSQLDSKLENSTGSTKSNEQKSNRSRKLSENFATNSVLNGLPLLSRDLDS